MDLIDNEKLRGSIEKVNTACQLMGEAIMKAMEPLMESLRKIFGEMPRYIIYEAQHPRKKPRGSIRRKRRSTWGRVRGAQSEH